MRIAKEIVLWILTLLLVALFLNAGIRKFPEDGGWSSNFVRLGLPVWFRMLIGVVETLAALLLLHPRTAAYGALLIIPTMIGAVAMVLRHFPLHGVIVPAIALVLATIVLLGRWQRRLRVNARSYSFQRRIDSSM